MYFNDEMWSNNKWEHCVKIYFWFSSKTFEIPNWAKAIKSWEGNSILFMCDYGPPKIHKSDYPLGLIVYAIKSATHSSASFLSTILTQVINKSIHHVKDSWHFVNDFKNLVIPKECFQKPALSSRYSNYNSKYLRSHIKSMIYGLIDHVSLIIIIRYYWSDSW